MSGWRVFLARLVRRIWFRASVFTVAAVALALVAGFLGPWLPDALAFDIGQDSVASILQILASSMLAVTTFSLTAMVAAYSSAATIATPRATQLLVEDRTSQNALSSFLGSFVFAIVAIVALSTDYYGERGRTVLYLGTLAVIAAVVVTLLRWISHLGSFGRMADVIERVEEAATTAIRDHAAHPHLGASPPVPVPSSARPVVSTATGYVTHVEISDLIHLCETKDLVVHVQVLPGSGADRDTVLAHVEGDADDSVLDAVRGTFRIEATRTYEQDPRLGLIALSEIGSRALSPAVNDPGTAIQILAALDRVLTAMLTAGGPEEPRTERVRAPAPEFSDLIEDAFRPISRDGARLVEVGLRLQRTLGALVAVADPARSRTLRAASASALSRAERALDDPEDLRQLRRAAKRAAERRLPRG
ncbi:DUF2254 domain-containing protein [Homoserinibacter sp. GY 40078]|uniref:DUF2254 domain-containing protein n=1 Tax=Homoserinibacter sp. GY 40078 TaxID=2603275 RepID=UPI0011CACC0E|nr:DUF2254 domain-containing protein [Homoserinibacter sp. GY 40078]TXK18638.1 DUF2254 domain-containing protein [Homoserinibacter sp. GY 40078]